MRHHIFSRGSHVYNSPIYDITPCSETTIRAMLKNIEPSPVQQYELKRLEILKPSAVEVKGEESQEKDLL